MRRIVRLIVLAGLLPATPAQAQVMTNLHSFVGGPNDGGGPTGSLIQYGQSLYGMTSGGGINSSGTIFQIGTDGTGFGLMYRFTGLSNDGNDPHGSLMQYGSAFWGLTYGGGASHDGTMFQINTDGTNFALRYQFAGPPTDGTGPMASLAQSGGVFFGMTQTGGTANQGTVFKVNPDGSGRTILHSFAGGATDGSLPLACTPLVSGGVVYGMTVGGGTTGGGVIFKVNADGTGYTVLHNFTGSASDGFAPYGSLTLSNGILYGTTAEGGPNNKGMIFRINPDGSGFGALRFFTGSPTDGGFPEGGLLQVGQRFYGMTTKGGIDALGTLFGIDTDGADFTLLHSFTGGRGDGAGPAGDLIGDGSTFYGMTDAGGTANQGVIFRFSTVPEPSSLLLAGAAALALAARSRWKSGRKLAATSRGDDKPGR